ALSNPTGGSVLGTHATATVTITNVGGLLAPASPDSYTVVAGTTLIVPNSGVPANDTAVGPYQTLQVQAASVPSHGGLTLGPGGDFVYTPAADFSGTDSFTYRVSDGTHVTPPTTVTITVTPTRCGPHPRVQSTTAA